MIEKSFCEASHSHSPSPSPSPTHSHSHSNSHSHEFYHPGIGGGLHPPYQYIVKYMAVAVAIAVAVNGAGAVAVAVAGLTKRFFNHIQKDFLINVWGCQGYQKLSLIHI